MKNNSMKNVRTVVKNPFVTGSRLLYRVYTLVTPYIQRPRDFGLTRSDGE